MAEKDEGSRQKDQRAEVPRQVEHAESEKIEIMLY